MKDKIFQDGLFITGSPNHQIRLWWITEESLTLIDFKNFSIPPYCEPTITSSNGTNILDYITHNKAATYKRNIPESDEFKRQNVHPNTFYFRMARPIISYDNLNPIIPDQTLPEDDREIKYIISSQNQLIILARQLEAICRIVEPQNDTLDKIYGIEIRNLIIITCTEVETHLRGIIKNNASESIQTKIDQDKPLNTNCYVELLKPMLLNEYYVKFRRFPDIEPISPFSLWNTSNPTKSLPWYNAYNGIKHNRENEFGKATLSCAFHSLAACIILFVAQFGKKNLPEDLLYFFDIKEPDWPINEMYIQTGPEFNWNGEKYFERQP